jgi:hypothetical protein
MINFIWTRQELRDLADFIMNQANPYQPHTARKPNWLADVRLDARPQTWTFRNTPIRVERAVEIPYLVWYPTTGNPQDDNDADWFGATEQLLVGYVGAGGW